MKKWMQQIPRFLENLCVSFTLAMLLYSLWGAQKETMRRGWLYEIFFICVLATLLQGVFFYENRWTKRISYLWRMVFYGVAMLVVVSLCAIGFQWFPRTDLQNWLVFWGVFLAGFVLIALVFEISFRFRRKVYQEALDRYKMEQKK